MPCLRVSNVPDNLYRSLERERVKERERKREREREREGVVE
jgi:hypothetical protein